MHFNQIIIKNRKLGREPRVAIIVCKFMNAFDAPSKCHMIMEIMLKSVTKNCNVISQSMRSITYAPILVFHLYVDFFDGILFC